MRDSISGFTLYSEKCFSESEDSITKILKRINDRFGIPSGTISDMRAGILSAIRKVFPGIPTRICLMHFLRDLGKDLMKDMHTDLGMMINRMGIKSRIKVIFRDLPEYDMKCIRRILEPIMGTGSSGYGFPFSLRHFNFYNACVNAKREIDDLRNVVKDGNSHDILEELSDLISKVADNSAIHDLASRIGSVNATFQALRKAFHIPERGELSEDIDNIKDDETVHDTCNIFIGQMKAILKGGASTHDIDPAKQIIAAYEKWEVHLFAQNSAGTIPRTNNSIEQFFRKIRRNVRKRTGNIATGRLLSLNGDKLAIFQNMAIPKYMKLIFGTSSTASRFGSYRKGLRKNSIHSIPRKRIVELVDKGKKDLVSGKLRNEPYSDEIMGIAYNARDTELKQGS